MSELYNNYITAHGGRGLYMEDLNKGFLRCTTCILGCTEACASEEDENKVVIKGYN